MNTDTDTTTTTIDTSADRQFLGSLKVIVSDEPIDRMLTFIDRVRSYKDRISLGAVLEAAGDDHMLLGLSFAILLDQDDCWALCSTLEHARQNFPDADEEEPFNRHIPFGDVCLRVMYGDSRKELAALKTHAKAG